jgi:hypothetical protein
LQIPEKFFTLKAQEEKIREEKLKQEEKTVPDFSSPIVFQRIGHEVSLKQHLKEEAEKIKHHGLAIVSVSA